MNEAAEFILTLSCCDRPGIVHAVSGLLYEAGCNIIDSQQFGDLPAPDDAQSLHATGLFFMRVHFAAPAPLADLAALHAHFALARERFAMELQLHALAARPRLMLMVSREGHCLNDLLFRSQSGQLRADIAAVVSNHPGLGALAANYGVAFHHLPLAAGAPPEAKAAQEQAVQRLIEDEHIDLVVLARYMQILSPAFCDFLKGRAINIHHSFLPSFKGARPYLQAHDRGVKLIGATAHYVTADLDEGPIIEQDVARVDHSLDPEDFAAVGRDVESVVLARAVQWHVEHRVLMNGPKTVVFR
ncbi:MAG: formyltetrahydrofolate deformylase [Burkholderiales bacterium]